MREGGEVDDKSVIARGGLCLRPGGNRSFHALMCLPASESNLLGAAHWGCDEAHNDQGRKNQGLV
jgi:hypothetical protein